MLDEKMDGSLSQSLFLRMRFRIGPDPSESSKRWDRMGWDGVSKERLHQARTKSPWRTNLSVAIPRHVVVVVGRVTSVKWVGAWEYIFRGSPEDGSKSCHVGKCSQGMKSEQWRRPRRGPEAGKSALGLADEAPSVGDSEDISKRIEFCVRSVRPVVVSAIAWTMAQLLTEDSPGLASLDLVCWAL